MAVDLKAAFDRVWRSGLLRTLASADVPSAWLRWLRGWLSDRRARVRWNDTLSRSRCMSAGVPQGSPLSPLCFDIFTAGLPDAIKAASPGVQVVQYADDITLAVQHHIPARAALPMQNALDALSSWASDHEVRVASEKTEAIVFTVDPAQVNGKCQPSLNLSGTQLTYNATPTILGVKFDSQLRFNAQAQKAATTMAGRVNILRALAGTSWGCDEATLRSLYVGYARPAALYAAGVWYPFLSRTHTNRLESLNYAAARVITGAPRGSNAVATCREAGLAPLTLLARRDAATLLAHAQRFPEGHVLHGLSTSSPDVPRRLRSGRDALRSSWFDVAQNALRDTLPPNAVVESWPDPRSMSAPWDLTGSHSIVFLLAGDSVRRDDVPEARRNAALEDLSRLRSGSAPAVEIWSDGAAISGTHHGGAGCVIRWHDGRPDSVLSCAAGSLASSTTAEAVAARLGLQHVTDALGTFYDHLQVRLFFDSRALHQRLQQPAWRLPDCATRDCALLLRTLAERHPVSVVWVPGHAGLARNEAADAAATVARDTADQSLAPPLPEAAVKTALARACDTDWLADYREKLGGAPPHTHFESSGGGKTADFSDLRREDAVKLHRLRLNRLPELRDTLHRWSRPGAGDGSCLRCNGSRREDTRHFLLDCPALESLRLLSLGPSPALSILSEGPRNVLDFLKSVADATRVS